MALYHARDSRTCRQSLPVSAKNACWGVASMGVCEQTVMDHAGHSTIYDNMVPHNTCILEYGRHDCVQTRLVACIARIQSIC